MDRSHLIDSICAYADRLDAPEEPFDTDIEGLSVVRARQTTGFYGTLYSPLLCLVLQGAKESYLGDAAVPFRAGEALIVSLNMPTVSRIIEAAPEAPYIALALELDLGIVREFYAELGGEVYGEDDSPAIVTGHADEELIDAMGRLFGLLSRPVEQGIMLPLLKREIHMRLLLADHGGMLRRLASHDSRESRITRALERIKRDFREPLRVDDLAGLSGMSTSNFHKHFKAVTAMTPLQYQKNLRLLDARQRIVSGESVSAAAFGVGYESPTQFSREYARKFGSPPSQDRAAAAI